MEIFERITISIQKCNPTPGPLVSWRVPPSKSRLRFCWRHQLPRPLQLHHSNQVLQMFPKKWESDQILPSAFTSLWNCKECSVQYSSHGTASFTIRKIFLSFVPHPNLGVSKKLAFSLRNNAKEMLAANKKSFSDKFSDTKVVWRGGCVQLLGSQRRARSDQPSFQVHVYHYSFQVHTYISLSHVCKHHNFVKRRVINTYL